jgi:hypothetical protein
MKGQSFVVELILFFIISFSLFTTISYLFHSQNIFYQERVGETTSDLINDLVSTDILKGVSCRGCYEVIITEEIPSRIGGFFYKIQLNNQGLNTILFSTRTFSRQNPIFNLNTTYQTLSGESVSENKIVRVKINNKDESIGVGE